eukprot:GHRQ01036139.1.p1 GENE.GHRQ01036139.1~~GHRQ01036139.1.p1  ORF type:complete len:157 (-),score=13.10 GHRQ01036139.1:362-832(-)
MQPSHLIQLLRIRHCSEAAELYRCACRCRALSLPPPLVQHVEYRVERYTVRVACSIHCCGSLRELPHHFLPHAVAVLPRSCYIPFKVPRLQVKEDEVHGMRDRHRAAETQASQSGIVQAAEAARQREEGNMTAPAGACHVAGLLHMLVGQTRFSTC